MCVFTVQLLLKEKPTPCPVHTQGSSGWASENQAELPLPHGRSSPPVAKILRLRTPLTRWIFPVGLSLTMALGTVVQFDLHSDSPPDWASFPRDSPSQVAEPAAWELQPLHRAKVSREQPAWALELCVSLVLDLSSQFSPTESSRLLNFFMDLNNLSAIQALKVLRQPSTNTTADVGEMTQMTAASE